jgi:PAS domain S-box-containing protein
VTSTRNIAGSKSGGDVTNESRAQGKSFSAPRLLLSVVLALAIFVGDTIAHAEIAVGVLYVAVVLVTARFYQQRGIALVGAACIALTVLSFFLTSHTDEFQGITNTLLSIVAIGLTTFLVAQNQSAEGRLHEQANLLSLTHDAIFVRDLNDTVSYWNRGAEQLYGWTTEEVLGQTAHTLLKTIFPARFEDIKAEVLRSGRWEGDLVHTRRDGTQITVASRWALRQQQPGWSPAVLEINNDITERKRAEEQIRLLNRELENRVVERTRELEAVNKELEAFAYSVSHDLRAPLRHTVGYAELLQKSAASVLDEKSRRYTVMIMESAKRMGTLIDDLLAFSRVGRAEIQKAVVNLDQIVKEALSQVRQDADGRNIAWRVSALPSVHGDRSMLRLVLVNLISNAVKFTRTRAQAEIEIGCANGRADEMVLFIRDNGVGFDMKYLKKLFGVFQRLHRTEEFEGTGIGLATVQRVIHRHGGRVWAEGAIDQGATFYLSLPKE